MCSLRVGKLGSLWLALLVLASTLFFGASRAGTELYDYDAIGRLIRYTDSRGDVTEYVYDPVGNILAVRRAAAVLPPVVASISPSSMRRGQSAPVTITGSNLRDVRLSFDDPGLAATGVSTTDSRVSFSLAVALTAGLGAKAIRLTNSAGAATATLVVTPELPRVMVDPTPLAIPPDGVPRPITIRLSHTDTIGHSLALSLSNARATIAPASVTIAAGGTTATAIITGVSEGHATLTLASATLGDTLVPVFITGEFRGINTSYSAPLGLVLLGGAPPPPTPIGPVTGGPLGVVLGSFIRSVAPTTFAVGTGPTLLTVTGIGLSAARAIAIAPPTGVTLGELSVAADGSSVSVPVTVAADAPTSPRRVLVAGPAGAFPAASADADRINIVRPSPEILSIDPIVGLQDTLMTLTIRGRNLHGAGSVALSPPSGITVGTPPLVNADGTVVTAMVSIAFDAPVGARSVVVTTPGGASPAAAGPANTFTVGTAVVRIVTPVVSPLLGLVLEREAPPGLPNSIFTPALGVAFGSVVTSVAPDVGVVGQVVSITLQGRELGGVSAVQFAPADGLAVGPVTVAADGRSVTLDVTIAADAAQTLRAVKVFAGARAVPFTPAGAALFRVTAPAAVIDSMTPITLQVGLPPAPLTLRGRNFQSAEQVRIVPAEAVVISPPVVNTAGSEISVTISAAAAAATGPRAVVVVTPGGESSSVPGPQNTLTLTATPGTGVTPLVSPQLGVVKLKGAPPPPTPIGPLVAPLLGVVLGDPAPPPAPTRSAFAGQLGVALGPIATTVSPTGFAPDTAGTLIITGFALDGVTEVSANPADGVTLGTATITADGRRLTVPIAIAAGAPATVREIRLRSGAVPVAFADPAAGRIVIGPGVPHFDSITPIVAVRGTTFTLTIRGARFKGATAVSALPAVGITFSDTFTVNADGTQLDVLVSVAADAPIGSRVIQVAVPGAVSSPLPSPANTLTVVAP